MKWVPSSLVLLLVLGCTSQTTTKFVEGVHLGMTREQVIAVMGTPSNRTARGPVEILVYELAPDGNAPNYRRPNYVRLYEGRVESIGEGHGSLAGPFAIPSREVKDLGPGEKMRVEETDTGSRLVRDAK